MLRRVHIEFKSEDKVIFTTFARQKTYTINSFPPEGVDLITLEPYKDVSVGIVAERYDDILDIICKKHPDDEWIDIGHAGYLNFDDYRVDVLNKKVCSSVFEVNIME